MGAGRPTNYKPEYCQMLIDHMKEGGSIEEFCLEIDVCKQTIYNWTEQYPEFLDSKKRGESFSEGWWRKSGRKNLQNRDFNYTGWYMNMKNRFGWSDKTESKNEHTIHLPPLDFADDE
jgi:hypothetical protein